MPRPSLDQIAAAADEAKRRQQDERVRQMTAELADEIEKLKAEDWQAPHDVDLPPPFEQPAPADWWVREQIAKAKARGHLAEEPSEDAGSQGWFTLDETDD